MKNQNFKVWISINILMFITAIYGYSILSTQQFVDKTGISYLIIILFVLFYALNIINTLDYQKEKKILDKSTLPKYNAEIDDLDFEGTGLFALHIGNLSDIYRNMHDGEVNQDRTLDVIANRLYRKEYFVQLGSNIMITVGLIGTITGLIIAMTGLETVMTSLSESGDNIIEGLQNALSGMGTAFYTTLFGAILGGFFLKLLHQASSNMADEIIDEIAIKSEIHVLPFLKKTVENHINAQSTQLLEYVNQSRQLLESESEKVRDYLTSIDDLKINIEKFNNKIDDLMKINIEKFNNKMEELETNMDGTQLTILKEIDSTLKQIQKDSKPFINRLFRKS
jgi:hypothetical protein